MREQQNGKSIKAGAFPIDTAGSSDQPAGYRKEQEQSAETRTRLRNVADILRQTGV